MICTQIENKCTQIENINIQKMQLEDLIASRKALINNNGCFDDDVVERVYKSICERVKHENNK
jgi:hypothetical protein